MRETRGKRKYKSKLGNKIIDNIYHNLKSYIIVTIIFLIGIVAGVIFINHINDGQKSEISNYIHNFITSLKGNYEINRGELLKNSLTENFKLTLSMWFIGSTVIGVPIVLGIVLYRGFCIGYTISSAIAVLGMQKGVIFSFSSILIQNIIVIPVLLALAVSGMKLYASIMKDKRRENIKVEIIRHTIISIMLFLVLVIASLAEVYLSSSLLTMCLSFL